MTTDIQERLRRSVRDVTTSHFNCGEFEHDPPEFEDLDDVFQIGNYILDSRRCPENVYIFGT